MSQARDKGVAGQAGFVSVSEQGGVNKPVGLLRLARITQLGVE